MRTINALMLVFVLLAACMQPPRRVPGYKLCSSDAQCEEDEYCGFKEVDTYAVCLPDPDQ